jgi:hypothetical protein
VKNNDISSAMKKAANISFRFTGMWRMLCFFVTMILVALLVFIPIIILSILPQYGVQFALANTYLIMLNIFLSILYFPLQQIMLVYFYNDLYLRFASKPWFIFKRHL